MPDEADLDASISEMLTDDIRGVSSEALQNCTNCSATLTDRNRDFGSDVLCISCADMQAAGEIDIEIPEEQPRLETYRNWQQLTPCLEQGTVIKSGRTFGVELEVIAPNKTALETVSQLLGKNWGVSSDGSIRANGSGYGVELQTPPLQGKHGEEEILRACKLLIDHGFRVNKTCGLHVHFGAKDFKLEDVTEDEQEAAHKYYSGNGIYPSVREHVLAEHNRKTNRLKRLFSSYIALEPLLLAMLPISRRNNHYCKPFRGRFSLETVGQANTYTEIEIMWYAVKEAMDAKRKKQGGKYDESRYRGVNFHALFGEKCPGTVEVRYHSGTINPTKVLNWVAFHQAIMDAAAVGSIDLEVCEDIANEIRFNAKIKKVKQALRLSDKLAHHIEGRVRRFINQNGNSCVA